MSSSVLRRRLFRLVGADAQRTEEPRSLAVRSKARRAGSRRAGVVIFVTAAAVVAVHESDNGFERHPHVETGLPRLGAARFDLGILGNGSGDRVGQLFCEPVHDVIHSCFLLTRRRAGIRGVSRSEPAQAGEAWQGSGAKDVHLYGFSLYGRLSAL